MKSSILAVLFISISFSARGADWRPISPEELAMKQAKNDPNADAECFFKDVKIENNLLGSIQNQTTTYIRFKIFNERGAKKYADREIEYTKGEHISDVSARTIHPDGTIIDLKRDAIFDKVVVKKGGLKVNAITFTFPSVEPGSIIEYRWAKNEGEHIGYYFPLDVQSEYPVDEVTFHVKPASSNYSSIPTMREMHFGCQPVAGNRDTQGFYPFTVKNVPAYRDEPYSPPGLTGKQWVLVFYSDSEATNQEKFWNAVGKESYNAGKEEMKTSGEMKQTAADVTAPGKTDDEKLALLALWCRKNIKNIRGDDITAEEREAYKANNTTSDTFKRKVGTPGDIDRVFVALARAAGYEATIAFVADRRLFLFSPEMRSSFFLDNTMAAAKVSDKWKFYDVANEFAAPGTVPWYAQGTYALMTDPKNSEFVQTAMMSSDDTKIQRIADLTLSETGDLEGSVRVLYWGNESIRWRMGHAHENDSEREAYIRENLKERFADFDVKDIKVTVSPDASKPVGVSYHLAVKGYAQRTGKRLFLRPGFFSVGQSAPFTDTERHNILFFDFPWSELDSVDIHLPAGFELDHAEAPPSFPFEPLGKYMTKVSIGKETNTLMYRRALIFGKDQPLVFGAENYKAIKSVFDQVHSSDEHMITLKEADPNAPAATSTTTTKQ